MSNENIEFGVPKDKLEKDEEISVLLVRIEELGRENKELLKEKIKSDELNVKLEEELKKQKTESDKKYFELTEKYKELEKNAISDPLTGIYNRRYFEEEAEKIISAINKPEQEERKEGYEHFSILFTDIDNFKNINDTLGHNVGDVVLKEVSKIINANVRDSDTVVRWGGEEFVVGLPGADEKEASIVAEKIRKAVEEYKSRAKITLSIGVACYNSDLDLGEFIKNADLAMYRAKKTGKNRVVKFSEISQDVDTVIPAKTGI